MAVEVPFAAQDLTYPAENTRRAVFFEFSAGGVKGTGCAATAPGGMSVSIATGESLVAGTVGATQGFYYVRVSAATSLTIATANPSNPRIDLVCESVTDIQYSGSGSSVAIVQVITGTAASSPVAPSLPASSLALVDVAVAAAASSINSGDLTSEIVSPTLAMGTEGLTVGSSAGAPTTGTWTKGEQWLDTSDLLWVCTVGGTPGTWVQVTFGASTVVVARVHMATTTGSISTGTAIPFDTVDFDTASGWSSSTHKYTVPTTGYYKVSSTLATSSSGPGVMIMHNSTEVTLGPAISATYSGGYTSYAGSVEDLISCTAGDTLWVTWSFSATTVEGNSAPELSWMTIHAVH